MDNKLKKTTSSVDNNHLEKSYTIVKISYIIDTTLNTTWFFFFKPVKTLSKLLLQY